MNKLQAFWAVAMSLIKASPIKEAKPNSNRARFRRPVRGYHVNGERVYYRPAAPWVANKKGYRFVRDEEQTGHRLEDGFEMSAQPQSSPSLCWPERLAAPVDPDETLLCMRAQSALSGPELGQVHDLSVEQARDVLAWYAPKH